MGHCDSPARHSGADRIFSADGRTPQPVAERARLSVSGPISQSTENHPGIVARTLLLLLRVYQTYLSSMNFSSCRFYPSCSHYAGEAVERFGARHGIWLALKRLARCQPFSRAGFDPVPDLIPNSRVSSHAESFQGSTASTASFNRSTSGVLTPEGSSHSSNIRATRGQEFAQ
jgi:putative membrane protein insertion efficiency factor